MFRLMGDFVPRLCPPRSQRGNIYYPAPGRGRGIVFGRFLAIVSMSARLRENGWTDLHEIFRECVEWPWDDLITFWVNSGKRVNFLLSPAIAQRTGVTKSVSFARWQQGAWFVVPRTTACLYCVYNLVTCLCGDLLIGVSPGLYVHLLGKSGLFHFFCPSLAPLLLAFIFCNIKICNFL